MARTSGTPTPLLADGSSFDVSVFDSTATYVYADGSARLTGNFVPAAGEVRPALRLDLASVLFASDASGSASITLPADFSAADTVQIFVEEANDDNSTDFASGYKQLAVPAPGGGCGATKYIRLWCKTTKYESNLLNWLLCILCFGWIWMAF